MKKLTLSETSRRISAAVRAEMARRGIRASQLAERIGRDRKYLYDRFGFRAAFSTEDLSDIAKALDISVQDIFASARLGEEMGKQEKAA